MGGMTDVALTSRTQRRGALPIETRVVLLEQDVDDVDLYHANVNEKLDGLSSQNNQILKWLVVGAITFAGSAAMLALNLATGTVR